MLLYNLPPSCIFPQTDQKLSQSSDLLYLVSPHSITLLLKGILTENIEEENIQQSQVPRGILKKLFTQDKPLATFIFFIKN